MAWRVAWAVPHLQRAFANGDGVAVMQPLIRCKALGMGKTETGALFGQSVDPELIALMRPNDGDAQCSRQHACGASMVDVGMGEPDGFESDAQFLGGGLNAIQVAAGIDDGGVQGVAAPDERAVLFKRGDGDGQVFQHAGNRGTVSPYST